ncbi:hypothetical protein N7541_001123 [Penicillium brevicompactum]|uniref:Grh/CP2 DB domain-containing protein n=1 Tax=Penicillium brevicompactum TaxID=5074 RepID=A0A9W9V3B2_PENBR|nr:hypothetical protein N7541_001123 [Penicillium brevicompactum]
MARLFGGIFCLEDTDAPHTVAPSDVDWKEQHSGTNGIIAKTTNVLPFVRSAAQSSSVHFFVDFALCLKLVSLREKFGDLLLTCHGERRRMAGAHVDVEDPMLHASYVDEKDPTDTEEVNTGRPLKLESCSPKSRTFYAPDSFSMIQHQSFPDSNPAGQTDHEMKTLMDRDSEYVTKDRADQDISTDDLFAQTDSFLDLATSEEPVNEYWPCDNGERLRYHVTLQAPTAMLWHANESPVTYLNKGQTYCLKVADSTPPTNKVGLFKYRTFVHISFEEEDQRSNPVACWQLWKESRGSKEVHEPKGKILAVEYVNFRGNFRDRGHIQLEEAFVDGFCITWTSDSTANIYEAAILLKFNFLSTDFTRSKGVKGVPVRLCAKTEVLRSDDENRAMEAGPEMCYCVVKLFRDHGAERKSANDKKLAEKRIVKLHKQNLDMKTAADFDRRNRNNSPMDGGNSILGFTGAGAKMTQIFSSARPFSVLGLRGNEKDDPDVYSISSSDGMSNFTKAGISKNQDSIPAIPSAYEGVAQLSKEANAESDLHNPGREVSFPPPQTHYSKSVACFYVQFTQSAKQPQGEYYAIYLAKRTSFCLKAKLAEKLQIDSSVISHIIWVNRKGLKVLVDDNMVQHLPEAQTMVADICEIPYTQETDDLRAKCSRVEVNLVF